MADETAAMTLVEPAPVPRPPPPSGDEAPALAWTASAALVRRTPLAMGGLTALGSVAILVLYGLPLTLGVAVAAAILAGCCAYATFVRGRSIVVDGDGVTVQVGRGRPRRRPWGEFDAWQTLEESSSGIGSLLFRVGLYADGVRLRPRKRWRAPLVLHVRRDGSAALQALVGTALPHDPAHWMTRHTMLVILAIVLGSVIFAVLLAAVMP